MPHDFAAQKQETFETFDEIGRIDDLPKRAVVNFLFLADDPDIDFTPAQAALRKLGFKTQVEDGETLEARIGPMEISAAAIWAEEERATRAVVALGFEPDGWELVEE